VSGKQGSKNLLTGVECVSHFLQWTKSITERIKFLFSRTRAFFQRRHQLFATLLLTAHNTSLKAAERRTMKKVHHIQHKQTLDAGKPPSSRKDSWKSFKVLFHAFSDLSTEKEHLIESPAFRCNGHDWYLCLYPGGTTDAENGQVSIFLYHVGSDSAELNFKVSILDKFGRERRCATCESSFNKDGMGTGMGWDDFICLDTILGESHQILDSNGTLAVVVSMKAEPAAPFIPNNPFQNDARHIPGRRNS
jgi:hypothetical protein